MKVAALLYRSSATTQVQHGSDHVGHHWWTIWRIITVWTGPEAHGESQMAEKLTGAGSAAVYGRWADSWGMLNLTWPRGGVAKTAPPSYFWHGKNCERYREQNYLASSGVILIVFFLQISEESSVEISEKVFARHVLWGHFVPER